jgi:hypothetical protein
VVPLIAVTVPNSRDACATKIAGMLAQIAIAAVSANNLVNAIRIFIVRVDLAGLASRPHG